MIRVTFIIDRGEESEAFVDKTFLPLLRALPDVERLDAARVLASAADLRPYALCDLYFADEARMNLAFASAEGRRVSREIMNSAGAGLEMITSEVLEA